MQAKYLRIVLLSLVVLFFFQMAGTLVESIYILDLLNTSLDEKALGVLFFFSPAVLFFRRGRLPRWLAPLSLLVLSVARGITPYLATGGRLLSSGIATAMALWLLIILLRQTAGKLAIDGSAALALATALSVLWRTVGRGLEYSLTTSGGWVGWLLAALLVVCYRLLRKAEEPAEAFLDLGSGFGLMLLLTLLLFSFSAPSVMARWVDGDYVLIVSLVSLLSLAYIAAVFLRPAWIHALLVKRTSLGMANGLFVLALQAAFLLHRVDFPPAPDAPAVVVSPPSFAQQVPLLIAILLLPIVFTTAAFFLQTPVQKDVRPSSFSAGILLGALAMVLLIFMIIFTNVWGYVEPVSPFFRNKYWLPFLLMTGAAMLLVFFRKSTTQEKPAAGRSMAPAVLPAALAACFLLTTGLAWWTTRTNPAPPGRTSLTVMTYNIQQANDGEAERSYLRQLALIRQIDPDIVALQESDSTRISLNNNDYVRYYASRLGYYSYFGPATTTGTYGTAILSRFPLENVRTVFSYSDKDEVGTAVAEFVVEGKRFTIFNVHPDGSDMAMMAFADALLEHARGLERVIVLGDYNLRHTEEAYQRIAAVYHNVPGSEGHIDHIFLSHDLQMINPVYIPAPASATDHPLLYATVRWD
ncbi:MAG TPA: endonuclease/exonuclease/phosphatase family protein [Bacillota bacterium]|nr:endonuclease/exonuclease/phosphatase family protein [Bacillota bacterium]